MFVPTIVNVEFSDVNKGHDQVTEIILCRFPNCTIIYPVGPVYCCPGHASNTIPYSYLKGFVLFQMLHWKLLSTVNLWTLKEHLGDINI